MFPFLVDIDMTQTRKMQNGNKTPTLYSFYEDQYDFNDLSRRVDSGMNAYISTLKKGKKYEKEFREAVSNLMAGVKDGTITFGNGRYNDSLGRYSNAKDKDKDVYGWAANYIYSNMGKSQKYVAPEDTTRIKWEGNSSIGRALIKDIFNSDSWNPQDFIDLDPYNEETGTRGTSGRVARLSNAFQNVRNNFDSLFTGYTDADKQNALSWINQALNAMKTDGFGDNDYLDLSRASGLDFRSMFSTQYRKSPETTVEGQQENQALGFVDWMQQNYPQFSGTLHSPLNLKTNQTLGTDTLTRFRQAISNLSDNDLYRIVRSSITDTNYVFNNEPFIRNTFAQNPQITNPFGLAEVLQNMKNRGLLQPFDQDNLNLYYIPTTSTNRQTAWVWDTTDNSVKEMSFHSIPYWRNRIQQEYNNYANSGSNSPSTGFEQFLRQAGYQFKKGGILKAQNGSPLWYSNLETNGDYDPAKYQYSYDTSRLVNADMSDTNWSPWVSNVAGLGVGRYRPTTGNTRSYTQGIEDTQYYKNFGNALLNPDGTFTDVGLAWAKAVDAQLPKGSKATFFDESGNLRTTWAPTTNDTYGRTKRQFNNLADYVNYVRNDQILGSRHNVFLNQGNRYFYKDQNGVEHWVDPNEISKYEVSANPVRSQWNDDNTIYWNDYELTGLKANPESPEDSTGTEVETPEDNSNRSWVLPLAGETTTPRNTNFGQIMASLTPDLIGAGRLFASLRTNNRVSRTLDRSLRPVLRDTYERYSPITGAFSEMQFRNRQAADLRRQASRPFTSDASLQLAGQLEADRQARDLEYQGFLADDKEIKRTQEAALARQEDNMARRSEVSNFNRASINQTNREKAQLEATRLRRNWQSVDNFLQGIESRLRTRLETDRERRNNFRLQTGVSDVETRYQDAIQGIIDDARNWQAKHPGEALSNMPNYNNYVNALREMTRWKAAQTYKTHADVYGYRYSNPYLAKDPTSILSAYGYKKGGVLKPSTMNLINKVIKNESYT